MDILHLTPWQEPCGIAGYAADLIAALRQQGTRNEVHAFNRRGRLYPLAEEVRAELDRFCARAKNFDIVHIQHEFSIFGDATCRIDRGIDHFGYVLARLRHVGKPVAVTFHTEPDFFKPLRHLTRGLSGAGDFYRGYLNHRSWRRRVRPFFHGKHRHIAFVHTNKARAGLVEAGFDATRVIQIPIGLTLRTERVRQIGRQYAREHLNYGPEAVVLSLFGFIAAYKGHDLAATALRSLPEHYQLAVVGGPHPQACDDETLDSILKMTADEPALKNRLRVTGFVPPETIDLYHAATDICLAPYRNFNLSASAGITWALTSGHPVIASRIPPFLEMQDEGECLLLFTENAEHELAWQIERLAADLPLREQLVRNAASYVGRYRWTNIAAKVLAAYESLLENSTARTNRWRFFRAA